MEISVVIPTFGRDSVLIDTCESLMRLAVPADEYILVDQTDVHDEVTDGKLHKWSDAGRISWIRLDSPSITKAMNTGLLAATKPIVLFLDDDIVPGDTLVIEHINAHRESNAAVVAGRVIQPWDKPGRKQLSNSDDFDFTSAKSVFVTQFMGGNFSVKRDLALETGGIDENFVKVAYRYEREFADRLVATGHRILYRPGACIRHLKTNHGGTRSFARRWTNPGHGVGEYYYLLRSELHENNISMFFKRPVRSVKTSYHRVHPWMIPVTLCVELIAMIWAFLLHLRGPRLIPRSAFSPSSESARSVT